MIPNPCIEIQTSPVDRFSVPEWFAEVVIVAQHLAMHELLEAFAHQVCLVRGRFGSYEPIDFLAVLIGYAISGERTLAGFFERVEPFEGAFMALFGPNVCPIAPRSVASSPMEIVPVSKPSARSSSSRAFPKDGQQKPLEASSIDRTVAPLSLMWTQRAKRHDSEHCPVLHCCLLLNDDLMPSACLATPVASAVRSSVHEPQPFKCIHANGSAPMQAEAMVTIVGNWPPPCYPS
jgi:hypothetical protein